LPGEAIATPASVDLVEAIPNGLRAEVVTVHGPTTLELWRRQPNGDVVFTGRSVPVRGAGVYTLVEPTPKRGQYLLVDRGLEGVFAVYDHEGYRARGLSHIPAFRSPDRPLPTVRDAARAPVT